MTGESPAVRTQRLDRWLWCARFFKTRTLAAKFVADGKIRVTRREKTVRAAKPSFVVGAGDTLVFSRGGRLRVIEVRARADRRGPTAEAQTLYADHSPPPPPKSEAAPGVFSRQSGAGRPTKKDRRAIDALKAP